MQQPQLCVSVTGATSGIRTAVNDIGERLILLAPDCVPSNFDGPAQLVLMEYDHCADRMFYTVYSGRAYHQHNYQGPMSNGWMNPTQQAEYAWRDGSFHRISYWEPVTGFSFLIDPGHIWIDVAFQQEGIPQVEGLCTHEDLLEPFLVHGTPMEAAQAAAELVFWNNRDGYQPELPFDELPTHYVQRPDWEYAQTVQYYPVQIPFVQSRPSSDQQ